MLYLLNGCYFDFKRRVKEFIDVVNQHIETVAANKVMKVLTPYQTVNVQVVESLQRERTGWNLANCTCNLMFFLKLKQTCVDLLLLAIASFPNLS